MSTNAVIHANNADIAQLTFSEPKVNKQGGKGVQLRYGGQSLQIRLPRMSFPAGVIQREDPNTKNVTYTLIASLKGCDPYGRERSTDTAIGPLYNFMLDLQEKMVAWGTENSAKLFGKKRSEESIRDSFKNLLSVSTDKQGDEYVPNGKYPPSLRLKIPVYDGRVDMDAVDGSMNPYALTPDSLQSVFQKYVQANLVITGSVYIIGQSFGVSWRVKNSQVFQQSRQSAASIFTAEDAEEPPVEESQEAPPAEEQAEEAPPAAGGGGGGGRRRRAQA
jgi:hypothetical protein